jgi:hypothetical protein
MKALTRLVPSIAPSCHARPRGVEQRAEARLELACTWGAGHMLVTGVDRLDARELLERVLRRVDALGTVRACACSPDPESALDGVFALTGEAGPLPVGRRERREALLRLAESARSLRRSVFVVVDDGDDATVEQLESLRASVEVTPEALERLRLIFLGGPTLVAKLNHRGARALSSRITARIRVGGATAPRKPRRTGRARPPSARRVFALTAAVCCALLAYRLVRFVFPPQGSDHETPSAVVSAPSAAVSLTAMPQVDPVATGLRGDEPFLGQQLRIPIEASWTTGSALFPPPKPEGATETSSPSVVPAPSAAHGAGAITAAAASPAPGRVSAELVAGTSIAALVARFR